MRATAMREANKLARILDPRVSSQIAWIQAVNAAPFFTAAQFATPAQILAMRAPNALLPYPTAMRHYARAVAYANLRNRSGFERELAKLNAMRQSAAFKPMVDQGVPAPDLLQLAETVAQAAKKIAEDFTPLSDHRGSAPYRALVARNLLIGFFGAPEQAQSPNNGWALWGLAASERAAGRTLQAAAADAALKRAWLGDPRWLRMDRL
jgi:hypothetical protein